MTGPDDNRIGIGRLSLGADSVAEMLFLAILVLLASGPVSGVVLWVNASLSSAINKGSYQVESTKNLAKELLVAGERIRLLEKQIADQQLELTQLRQEAKDVRKLRDLLSLKQSTLRKTIAADVIGRNMDNWFEQIQLDRGERDGVRLGSAVVTNNGIVGQIVKTDEHRCTVRLYTDPSQKIGVVLQRLNHPGILVGRNKKPPIIDYVPVGTNVEVGDKVTCTGNGGIFPPGHPVGSVSMVRRDSNGTSLNIEIRPAENLFDLTHVLIVPPIDR